MTFRVFKAWRAFLHFLWKPIIQAKYSVYEHFVGDEVKVLEKSGINIYATAFQVNRKSTLDATLPQFPSP